MNISNRLISTAARQRAAALLKELSLEEKVRQLGCTMLVSEDTDLTAKDLSGGIGEIALLDICEEPEALAARLRDVQQYVHPVLSALLAWHLPHLARRIGT